MSKDDASKVLAQLAVLDERVATLTNRVHDLTQCQLKLVAQANRWKGAFGLLLGIGGLVGWLVSTFSGRLFNGG